MIHKAKDNSSKMILSEPELFVEFLQSFVKLDILKDVTPEDVEDITERLISLLAEQKDGDTIKRINLKNNVPLFVIAIVERLSNMNVPQHLMELLVRVVTVLLSKIDVPQDEIKELVNKIDERGVSAMLAIENYSVQETRREARIEELITLIHRKKLKMKTREQIINELELDTNQVEILDNFEAYQHLILSL